MAIAPSVTIVSSPAGTPVSGSTNTFDYPILSSVTLICTVEPLPPLSLSIDVSYQWNTTGCYTNTGFNSGNPQCFPRGQTTQSVTGNDLNAEDAGTITCTVTISGSDYTSEPFTLRISGEQLVYCVIACIVYCKQCMLLLLATCYCCIIHQLLWFMYRGVFTIGIALLSGSDDVVLTNALPDYSYFNASDGNSTVIARCVTGLGPSGDDNGELGGLYLNGNAIPAENCSSAIIQPIPEDLSDLPGVINILQCGEFSTTFEGIYACTLRDSSMMDRSIRFGVYFAGRSESLAMIYISHHLTVFHLSTQLLQ